MYKPNQQYLQPLLISYPSETDIKMVGFREGKAINKHPHVLLSVYRIPGMLNMECDQPVS